MNEKDYYKFIFFLTTILKILNQFMRYHAELLKTLYQKDTDTDISQILSFVVYSISYNIFEYKIDTCDTCHNLKE